MGDKRPNFIIFMADDLGYGDLSCYGSSVCQTPHLDALAESGVRFTNWYSNAPICSASRASLMTGCYPARVGVPGNVPPVPPDQGLSLEFPTLASALGRLGYRTAMFGKWHLGRGDGYRPEHRGFNEWFGFLNGCIDYYSHIFYWGMAGGKVDPLHDLWEDGREVYQNGRYFTELITERALAYLHRTAEDDRPFFLYIPYNGPHYPMHAPPVYMERFGHLPWEQQVYAAMISAVDDSIGAIMAEIERQGRTEETCVFFQPDHGPSRETRNWLNGREDPYPGGSTGGLRGHKASLFDGGIHLPAIMSWPGRIPGGVVRDGVGAGMDIFPTFLTAAGGSLEEYALDGVDVMPMIASGEPSPQRDIFWSFQNQAAVLRDGWKLVLNGRVVDGPAADSVHLSNLKKDPGESTNLSSEYPDLVRELTDVIADWQRRVGLGDASTRGTGAGSGRPKGRGPLARRVRRT